MKFELTDDQYDQLEKQLSLKKLKSKALFADLLDHYYCLTTFYKDSGLDFENAAQKALQELAPNGVSAIEHETQILLHFNINIRMNRLLYSGAFLAAFGQTMYVLFRTLHWPGAGPMLLLGCGALFFMVLPVWILQFRENYSILTISKRLRILVGLTSISLFALGSAFKIFHWPGSNVQILIGTFLLALVFFPLFFWEQYQAANKARLVHS